MVASRNRPKGLKRKPFGLFLLLVLGLVPSQTGYQDLQALLARQPAVAEKLVALRCGIPDFNRAEMGQIGKRVAHALHHRHFARAGDEGDAEIPGVDRVAAKVGKAAEREGDDGRVSGGKSVEVAVKVDPSIIGGLIVKLGSRMVDGSRTNRKAKPAKRNDTYNDLRCTRCIRSAGASSR